MSLDEVLILQRLRIEHPGWTVGPSDAGPVWEAIIRPTPTSLHVLIGRTLPHPMHWRALAELSGIDDLTAPEHSKPCRSYS